MDIYSASFENGSLIVEWEAENSDIFNVLIIDKTTKEEREVATEDLTPDMISVMKSVMKFDPEKE